jgi:hypothetical protein
MRRGKGREQFRDYNGLDGDRELDVIRCGGRCRDPRRRYRGTYLSYDSERIAAAIQFVNLREFV